MSELEDLDDFAEASRYGGALSDKPSARVMRANAKKNAVRKNASKQPKWRRQLFAVRSYGAKARPVTVGVSPPDSNLLDDSMRKSISASMEAEQ